MDKIRFSGRHFYKMADTKVNKSQIQIIFTHWNRLSTYLYCDHNFTSLGRAVHEIYGYLSWRPPSLKMADINGGKGQK